MAQTTPQPPQFAVSFWASTQVNAQSTIPAGQPQTPLTHCSDPSQTTPQAPQFSRFVMMLWQEPLQQMLSTPQTLLHEQVASLNVVLNGQRVETQTSPQSW